jgi:hypothetical protein
MTRRRSLYARPEFIRGQQCAGAPLVQNDQARNNRHINPGKQLSPASLAGEGNRLMSPISAAMV